MSTSSPTWPWRAFVNSYACSLRIGPAALEHLGSLLATSTSVNLRKEDSMFGTRLWRMMMQEILPFSVPFSRMSVRSHSQTSQGRMLQPIVQYVLCPEFTGHFLSPCDWSTRCSLLFWRLWEPWWTFHPEWPRSSAYCQRETGRSPIPWWPIRRSGWLQNHFWECQEADHSWTSTKDTG